MSVNLPIKVAVIGYGHLGRWHLDKALSFDHVEVVGVVDPAPDTEQKLTDRGLAVRAYRTLDDIIDDIDAALVVAPTSLHFDLVDKLLKHDKHVFCEKPLTSTYEQALKVQESLDGKNLVFQVGHSERFHGVWEQLATEQQYLNDRCYLSIERQAPFKGRALDVDVVQDLMIHDLDLARYLLKETPTSIRAHGYKIRTNHWDYVRAELQYSSGRQVQIISGRNYTREVRSLEIMSSQGSVSVDLMNCNYSFAPHDSVDGSHVINHHYEKRDHLLEEQKRFFASIRDGSEVVVTIDDGVKAVHLVSKVLESLERGIEVGLD